MSTSAPVKEIWPGLIPFDVQIGIGSGKETELAVIVSAITPLETTETQPRSIKLILKRELIFINFWQ
jgi:hypothetical protein